MDFGLLQKSEVLLSAVMQVYKVYRYRTSLRSLAVLGAFAKLRKATISFVMSVRPSVRMEQLGSRWTHIHEISYFSIVRKSV